MLHADVNRIMKYIQNNADKNMIHLVLKLSSDNWLDGFKELNTIYDKFDKFDKNLIKNSIFLNKYWTFVKNSLEIIVMALSEKIGIHRQTNLTMTVKNSKYVYEPSEGIYTKVDKWHHLYVWW